MIMPNMNKGNMVVLTGGILFGFGLSYSGMTKQEIVLSFLRLEDLGLIFVLGGAALVVALAINVLAEIQETPVLGGEFKPRRRILSWSTIIGAVIFGVGWGISGQPYLFLHKQRSSRDYVFFQVQSLSPTLIGSKSSLSAHSSSMKQKGLTYTILVKPLFLLQRV